MLNLRLMKWAGDLAGSLWTAGLKRQPADPQQAFRLRPAMKPPAGPAPRPPLPSPAGAQPLMVSPQHQQQYQAILEQQRGSSGYASGNQLRPSMQRMLDTPRPREQQWQADMNALQPRFAEAQRRLLERQQTRQQALPGLP